MENASKALLIAGSILIVILLIAVGMMVFGGAQSNIEGSLASMSSQEKEAFNSQFLMYQGNQKGSSVKSMISKVIANNSNEGGHPVTVNTKSTDSDISAIMNTAVNTITYKVELEYTSGVITNIKVSGGTEKSTGYIAGVSQSEEK